jgi:hypothetical protein
MYNDPEFELCEAKSFLDSLGKHLSRVPPDAALKRMAAALTKLIEALSTLGKESYAKT